MCTQGKVLIAEGIAESQGIIGYPGTDDGPVLIIDDPILVHVDHDDIPYLGIGLGRIEYLGLVLEDPPKLIVVVHVDRLPDEPWVFPLRAVGRRPRSHSYGSKS